MFPLKERDTMSIEKRKEFWDVQHGKRNLKTLSGHTYSQTIPFLKIEFLIKPGVTILEVGVGTGYLTKQLHDLNCKISGLDISEIALKKVEPYCEHIYTLDNLEKLPNAYFDLIICMYVIQHIPNSFLEYELECILKSLKYNTGVFAMQFASSDKGEITPYTAREGLFCHSPEWIQSYIKRLGGTSNLMSSIKINHPLVQGVHVLHIKKKKK